MIKVQAKFDNQGMTLIEVLLYVAILAIFLNAAILFSWHIVQSQQRSQIQQRSLQAHQFAETKIKQLLSQSDGVISIYSHSICLSIPTSQRNPVLLSNQLDEIHVSWGGSAGDCSDVSSTYRLIPSSLTGNLEFQTESTDNTILGFTLTTESKPDRFGWTQQHSSQHSVEVSP